MTEEPMNLKMDQQKISKLNNKEREKIVEKTNKQTKNQKT